MTSQETSDKCNGPYTHNLPSLSMTATCRWCGRTVADLIKTRGHPPTQG